MAKFPEICHFLNLHVNSLGRHVNAASRKSVLYHNKTKNPLEAKICMKISFQLL